MEKRTYHTEPRKKVVVQFMEDDDYTVIWEILENLNIPFEHGANAIALDIDSLEELPVKAWRFCIDCLQTGRAQVIPQEEPGAVSVPILPRKLKERAERFARVQKEFYGNTH
jgi:hypothetical protein